MPRRIIITAGTLLLINTAFMAVMSNFNFGIIALGAVSAAVLTYGMYWHKLNRIIWIRIASICVCLFIILFSGSLAIYGNSDNAQYDEDAVIILGAGIRGEQVTLTLAQRLNEAVVYHKKNPNAVLVVSGGKGPQESITEALAMERYLVANGVPIEQIIKEEKSTSTYENFLYSGELLKQNFPHGYSAVFITNSFHVYRAARTAQSTGITARHIGATTIWYTIPANYLREMLAVIRTWIYRK